MNKVQKIREEVARIQLYTQSEVLKQVLDYIDEVQKEPVNDDLEEAASSFARKDSEGISNPANFYYTVADKARIFKASAKWQKENLWKPADGDDLPEYDREVVVLVKYNTQHNIHDEEYPTYRVGFGHRPNPNGWEGKNIDTNEVTHYTPKLYDKGRWNVPDIAYWLDVELPKELNYEQGRRIYFLE